MSERTCALDECNNPIPSSRHKYCSDRCKHRQWKLNRKANPDSWRRYLDEQNRRRQDSHEGSCAWCDRTFTSTKPAKYCSAECQGEAKRWRYLKNDRCEVPWRECQTCNEAFVARANNRWCSDECRPAEPPFVMGWCAHCEAGWVSKRTGRYCSPNCRDAFQRNLRGVTSTTRRKVHRRDKWRCQLCGGRVRRDVTVPHPQAATVDHILPVSQGGGDHMSNLQTAHFVCNSAKGNRAWNGAEQLRLVG